ncbi:hypothetical protein [Jiella sp. M17.18]|uniref:hypothetical protein n=1 Tax=Jiella sp. M17.18 TaxID=3234247 RepID=UPI0034DF2246
MPPIRVGIGARPASDARRVADLLAAAARSEFHRIKAQRMKQEDDERNGAEVEPMFSGDDPKEVAIEMRGYLKAMRGLIDKESAAPSADQLSAFEGMRGLVGIAREVERGAAGNPLVVDNADLLKGKYVDMFAGTALTPAAARSAAPVTAPGSATTLYAPGESASVPVAIPADRAPVQRDENGKPIPAFKLDRRFVPRRPSTMPHFSEVSEEYLAARESAKSGKNKDIGTARFRRDLFIELIGDHRVDTYDASDLQAYIHLLSFWPAEEKDRTPGWTARQIIDANRDRHLKPMKLKTMKDGYVGIVRSAINYKAASFGYADPFHRAVLRYPDTAAPPRSAEPLSAEKISRLFRVGVEGGILDEAMLPLLGHLTGRRLGLLIHLQGQDIREKYRGVFVAESPGVTRIGGVWKRVPFKTDASTNFFVLHPFLKEIGFIDWAMDQGENFLFPEIMRLVDPSKSASSYMQRLFEKAGIEKGQGEVFHSLRGGNIDEMREEKVDGRIRRLQVGHAVGSDEHEGYGRRTLSEKSAILLANLPLNPEIDFSVFRGLNFGVMAKRKRSRGRRPAAS